MIAGHLNLQDNDEILRKKVEKKLSGTDIEFSKDFSFFFLFFCTDQFVLIYNIYFFLEIKFHSVHGVYQKKKTRLSLSNSFSLPQRLKDGLIHRGKDNVHLKYQFLY